MKFGVVFSSMLLTIMLVVGAVLGKSEDKTDGAYRPLSVYTEVLAHIKSDYVEDPNVEQVTRGALQGLVEHLDPLSSYLTEQDYQDYKKALGNQDGGTGLATGLVVQKRGSFCAVLAVLPGSSAEAAGIRSGDLIEAIDSVSTRMLPPAMIRASLSGEPGTQVKVLVRTSRNYDEPEEFSIERRRVRLPNVESRMLDDRTGYVKALIVDKDRLSQIAKAVRELRAEGAAAIVLDLRENAYGDHALGLELADLFLDEGLLGTLKGQRFPEKSFSAKEEGALKGFDLAVLTDSRTAGAAEMAAAALLDRERAKIVGERTYGLSAHVEEIMLDDGAALLLTVAKYYRPNGESLHDKGLEPSDAVAAADLRRWRSPDQDSGEQREDPFIKRALEVLR